MESPDMTTIQHKNLQTNAVDNGEAWQRHSELLSKS